MAFFFNILLTAARFRATSRAIADMLSKWRQLPNITILAGTQANRPLFLIWILITIGLVFKIWLTAAHWRPTSGGHCRYAVQMPPLARYNYAGWASTAVLI